MAQALIPAPAAVCSDATSAFLLSAKILVAGMIAVPPASAADACPVLLNHLFQSLQDHKAQSFCQWHGMNAPKIFFLPDIEAGAELRQLTSTL